MEQILIRVKDEGYNIANFGWPYFKAAICLDIPTIIYFIL